MAVESTERWRLVVDATLCDGHGICVLHCPDLVTLDEWGYAGIENDVVDTPGPMRRARRAVAACPEGALSFRLVPLARDNYQAQTKPRGITSPR